MQRRTWACGQGGELDGFFRWVLGIEEVSLGRESGKTQTPIHLLSEPEEGLPSPLVEVTVCGIQRKGGRVKGLGRGAWEPRPGCRAAALSSGACQEGHAQCREGLGTGTRECFVFHEVGLGVLVEESVVAPGLKKESSAGFISAFI